MDIQRVQQKLDDANGPTSKLDKSNGQPVYVSEAKAYIEKRLKELPQSEELDAMWHVLKVVMADSNITIVARPKIK